MADLKTTFMGIPLQSPLLVAACSISSMIDRVRAAEQAGAGALVIRSLFEEQILYDALRLEESLAVSSETHAEALSYFPGLRHGEAKEHLYWVEKTRREVRMPLIASLNAVSSGAWARYARQLEATGVDGLELNVYQVSADPTKPGSDVERQLFDLVEAVRAEVHIPLAVKLSPFYTSLAHVAAELDRRNVQALVLFNRFLQPDIDPVREELVSEMVLSTSTELRLPLRWVALLCGRVRADLALSTGVHSGLDAAKALLAGATVVQTASALLRHGIPYLSTMLRELETWMDEHGYRSLADFRGRLSQQQAVDPTALERAHYIKLLMAQT